MNTGGDHQDGPGAAEKQTLIELFSDVLNLVDDKVARITDAEVGDRLHHFLRSAGSSTNRSARRPGRAAVRPGTRHKTGRQPGPGNFGRDARRTTHPARPAPMAPGGVEGNRRGNRSAAAARMPHAKPPVMAAGLGTATSGALAVRTDVAETLVAVRGGVAAEPDITGEAVCALYSSHYQSLVRLAALLVRDGATAEEVVQDAFVAMHGGWNRLRDTDKALSYLRQSVVNRCRSVLRHRGVVDKYAQKPPPDAPSAEQGAITLLERSAVVAALRRLPARQREALVLRYYADLSEADIAKAMGISRGAVKGHTARGMTTLRTVLDQEP